MSDPAETELKLSLPADQADALRSHVALHARVAGTRSNTGKPPRPRVARLINHYFDTDDRLLAANGMALRLRRSGGKWVQTLKIQGEGKGALSKRGEWEMPVAGPKLELARLRETPLAELARNERRGALGGTGKFAAQLVRLFTIEFRRETWALELEGGSRRIVRAELALDIGRISVGRARTRRTAPICEVEIELKEDSNEGTADGNAGGENAADAGGAGPDTRKRLSGPRATDALLEFAERLARDLVLLPLPLSKAERGYALLDGRTAEPVKPKMPKAHKNETATEHLAAIAAACQHALLINAHGFLGLPPAEEKDRLDIDSDHAEFIHQARVAMRYLRSALRAHREFLGRKRSGRVNEALRQTGRVLGAARDWDVFEAETLARIEPIVALDDFGKAAMRAVRAATSQKRREAETALLRYLGATEFGLTAIGTERFVATLARRAAPEVRAIAPRLLDRQHRRVFKLARVIATLDAEHRHQLRIEVKRLRYTFEFFIELYDEARVKAYKRALSDLQDELGKLNDSAVAVTLLGELAERGAPMPSTERSNEASDTDVSRVAVIGPESDAERTIDVARARVAEWVDARTRKELPKIAALTVQLELAGKPWAELPLPDGDRLADLMAQ